MALDARTLRERRKSRLAARTVIAKDTDEDMPDWLEQKIERQSEPGTDVGEEGIDEDVEQAETDETYGDNDVMEDEQAEDLEELGEDIEELAEDLEELNENEALEDEMEEAEEEEGEEEEAPVEEEEAEGVSLGAFQYNPVYQKPTHLGSNRPGSGYHYYGPPPDAGTSYGYYADASSGLRLIAPLSKAVYSPVSGKKMKYEGKVGIDGLASVLALADRMTKLSLAGGEERMTSAPLGEHDTPQVYDALTGDDISEAVATMRAEAEADEMLRGAQDDAAAMEEIDEPADLGEGVEDMDEAMEYEEEEEPGEAEAPVESADEMMDEGEDEEQEELPIEEDEAEAVKYEALQDVESYNDEPLTEADVHMTLFDDRDDNGHVLANPYWNVDIKGQPVARVYLQDQPRPEEIREVFCSADYQAGVSGAVEKVGLKPVLKQLNAHVWANRLHETKFAQKVRAEVEAEAQQRVTATTTNLMKDLLERIAVVCAGMDKNFYREVGNPLKEALWGELHAFGITNPSSMIEAAFRKGSTKYFETVLNKAVEYMEMEPKALAQVRRAIGDADVLPAGDSVQGDELPDATPTSSEEMPTLNERLAASSMALGGIPALAGDAIGDHKQALRNELRLGGAGPRTRR